MDKEVPFSINYEHVEQFDNVSNVLLYSSAAVSLLVLYTEISNPLNKDLIQSNLSSILACISVIFFIFNIIQNYLFHLAEFNRKKDFIDNSFKTKFSEKNSIGYFSNDNTSSGIFKLGVNCFENAFFTKKITEKMLFWRIVKCLLIVSLYILVAIFADNKIFKILLQMTLPFAIIQKTVKLLILKSRVTTIFSDFKKIYTTTIETFKDALIIDNVLSYEKTLSWTCVLLDSKVFNKLNAALTIEWERIKKDHSL